MRPVLRVALSVMALMGAVGATSARAGAAQDATFYLSLGDSLAAGAQPPYTSGGHGYANQPYREVREDFPGLRLTKLGCPGESTDTMIRGGICPFPEGSQLDQAIAFLQSFERQVAFITIDIGANDILGTDGFSCWDEQSGLIDLACVRVEVPGIQSNLLYLIGSLRAAAPGVRILGMSYFDPFLGYWVLGPHGHQVARADEESMEALNAGLVRTYRDEGVVVAHVDGPEAFDTANFTDKVWTQEWGLIPVNVPRACDWTWFCSDDYTFDVHPTTGGYGVIAEAFEEVFDR